MGREGEKRSRTVSASSAGPGMPKGNVTAMAAADPARRGALGSLGQLGAAWGSLRANNSVGSDLAGPEAALLEAVDAASIIADPFASPRSAIPYN